MARLFDVFFEIDAAIFECVFCFLNSGSKAGMKADIVMSNAHASATAACRCFDQYGITHGVGQSKCFFVFGDKPFAAWYNRNACLLGHFAGFVFIA